MTDRRSYDMPAAALAAAFGVALIAIGLPFAILAFPEAAEPDVFNVLWSETAIGAQSATLAEGETRSVEVKADGVLTSHVRLVPGECTDSTNSPLAGPALLRYRLLRRGDAGTDEVLREGEVTCATKGNAQSTLERAGRPDVGSVQAEDEDQARQKVWAQVTGNETATYRLEVTATRQAGAGGPLPNPVAPTLRAVFSLEVDHWAAAVVPAEPEVTVR
jgi:hypothetical protein